MVRGGKDAVRAWRADGQAMRAMMDGQPPETTQDPVFEPRGSTGSPGSSIIHWGRQQRQDRGGAARPEQDGRRAMAGTEAAEAGEIRGYLYEHVTPRVLAEDMRFRDGALRPGDRLPGFDLPTADGGRFSTADWAGRRPVLLVTGSFTCPMTASSNPMLKRLHAEFGDRVEFVMLHVREAHPGERWEQTSALEEKTAHARALKERDGLPWTVAVDDPSGGVHRAHFDEKPNAAFLAGRDGEIVFRSLWAGDERGLRQALGSAARGERPRERESTRRMVPMAMGIGMMREMTRRAGPRAERDIWRAAPPMAALAWVADLYRPLPLQWRAYAAMATVALATASAIALLTRDDTR